MNLPLLTDPFKIKAAGWSSFVYSHPDVTVFQSPEMYDFLSVVPGFEPVICAAMDEDGRLAGVLLGVIIREMKGLGGYFSSRAVIYGGPLIDPASPDRDGVLDILLQGLVGQVQHRSIFIQFRNFFDPASFTCQFKDKGFHLRNRLNLIVDTSDRETVVRNMSASRWRQIRKGLGIQSAVGSRQSEIRNQKSESQARIITPSSLSQVRLFYDILFNLYKYKVKKPLPPWAFFEQFYHFSQAGKLGVILLVEYRGEVIGGILSPVTPGKTIYEWYVCGLDHEHKAVHPSVLATWGAIDYALNHGIPAFDFMGVGIPEREYGVRDFKARFGGELVNYGRFARINNRLFYTVSEAGYNVLSWLKKV